MLSQSVISLTLWMGYKFVRGKFMVVLFLLHYLILIKLNSARGSCTGGGGGRVGKELENQTSVIVSKMTQETSYGLKFPIKYEPT